MDAQRLFSRRHMLALSAAAGGLAIGGSYRDAAAQAAKRIERLDPALDQIISASEPIVDLATNLGGTANVEGPLWWKEGGYLLFRGTDLRKGLSPEELQKVTDNWMVWFKRLTEEGKAAMEESKTDTELIVA